MTTSLMKNDNSPKLRRRKASIFMCEDVETSELEHEEKNCYLLRKPAGISYVEDFTIISDDDNFSNHPAPQIPSSYDERETPEHTPSFWEYCWSQLTLGYNLKQDQRRYTEKRRKLYALFWIPVQVEKFLFYGQLQCVDAFLYLFTFLPIRLLLSVFYLLRFKRWGSAEVCDFIKIGIMFCASVMMQSIDTSVVYHEVRSQGVIKLYIFYNMLEVADKLFSSLGQDILEALFWTANEPLSFKNCVRIAFHYTIATLYTSAHTFLVLLQATTLNVAFNSHNQALLAIMMSNNFVELKGSVFKKFAKANLFQMACSDVRERFHIMSLLFIVILRNMVAVNWSMDHFIEMLPDIIMVLGAELIVDWLKHVFITKFNEINADVYKDFTITISFDVIKNREKSSFNSYSDQVSRRMGFIPIPLSIMLIRVLTQTFSFTTFPTIFLTAIAWLILLAIKISNGIILLGMACKHVSHFRDLQIHAECEFHWKKMLFKKSKSAPNSPKMSLIDFTDVCHQPSGKQDLTASDIIDQLRLISQEGKKRKDVTPRRTHSLANLPRAKQDRSESQSGIPEIKEPTKEIEEASESQSQAADDLSSVQAYTMLPPEQGEERIE